MSSTFAGVFCASGLGHRRRGVFESIFATRSSPPTSHPTPTPRKPFRVGVGWRVGGVEQVENARRKIIDPTHSPPRLLAKVGSWPTRSSAPPFYEWRPVDRIFSRARCFFILSLPERRPSQVDAQGSLIGNHVRRRTAFRQIRPAFRPCTSCTIPHAQQPPSLALQATHPCPTLPPGSRHSDRRAPPPACCAPRCVTCRARTCASVSTLGL